MTRPAWLDGLSERDASLSLALAALVHAADESGRADLDRLVMAYRSTFLSAVETVPGLGRSELTGDQLRESLTQSVLPRLASGGWIADGARTEWTERAGGATMVAGGRARSRRLDGIAPRRGPGGAPAPRKRGPRGRRARERAGGHRAPEELPPARGGGRRLGPRGAGGDRGPPRPQRRRQDRHLLLPDRDHPARRGQRPAQRRGHDVRPDVPAGPARPRLPGAGAVGVPAADGRGKRAGDPRDAADLAGGTAGAARGHAGRALHQAPAARAWPIR